MKLFNRECDVVLIKDFSSRTKGKSISGPAFVTQNSVLSWETRNEKFNLSKLFQKKRSQCAGTIERVDRKLLTEVPMRRIGLHVEECEK